ncbi:MAG: hypothetical protein NDJ92_16590 [Thermoanaerobaculia bacterium]|nr:hypothetical protein [Thermoanaerobaculia bacterium]
MVRALFAASALALALLPGCKARQPAPVSIAPAVAAELGRLEAAFAGIDPAAVPEFARGIIEQDKTLLERARSATSPQLRLYRLRDATVGVDTLAFIVAHRAEAADLEKFRALWESEADSFAIESPRRGGPLVERALAQAARNRAMRLYRASLPYGKASDVESGLYYLGEAMSTLRYARFVESLPVDARVIEPTPPAGALEAALAALEAETVGAFEADRARNDHVYASSLLKEARELYEQKLHDGASLLLLEARLALSRATKKPEKPDLPMPEIPTSASEASLTSLFASVGRQRGADIAALVVSDVLPFYASLYRPTAVAAATESPVTVTLVRWPYT